MVKMDILRNKFPEDLIDGHYKESIGHLHNLLGEELTAEMLDRCGTFPVISTNWLINAGFFSQLKGSEDIGEIFYASLIESAAINLHPTNPHFMYNELLESKVADVDFMERVRIISSPERIIISKKLIH